MQACGLWCVFESACLLACDQVVAIMESRDPKANTKLVRLHSPSRMELRSAKMSAAKGDGSPKQLTGITHWYVVGDRNYSMHFIKFDGLKPATHYTYKVKSGAQGAQ